jgi:hypothetical protein
MTSSAGLLDFYILEATEYIDRLDALLHASAPGAPDPDRFASAARALRGSSTMAKLGAIADMAGALERTARATRERRLVWTGELQGAVVGAVSELRILLGQVRHWSAASDQRAATRTAALVSLLPEVARPTPPGGQGANPTFFASEADAIGASIEGYLAGSGGTRALMEAVSRARSLRGIAALKDYPPLGEVMAGIDRAAAMDAPTSQANAPRVNALLGAAARVLRRAAVELRAGAQADPSAPEIGRFADAVAALEDRPSSDTPVVPIESLFYGDAGPHIVSRGARPGSSVEERFRVEMLTHAEHLRRLVADALEARDLASRDRAARELRLAARQLKSVGASFGAARIGAFFGAVADDHDVLAAISLDSVEAAAALLTAGLPLADLEQRVDELARGRALDENVGRGFGTITRTPPVATTPVAPATPVPPPAAMQAPAKHAAPRPGSPLPPPAPRPAPMRRSPVTPTGRELESWLGDGIAGLRPLDEAPLSEPAALDDAGIVPIESLIYRGRSALDRAVELRNEIRARGGATDEELAELFDLLDLAAAE